MDKDIVVTQGPQGPKATLQARAVGAPIAHAPPRVQGTVVNAESDFALRAYSALVSRLQLANRIGKSFGGLRDYYAIFGYKRILTANDFLGKYGRQDIASRVIDAPPNAVWTNPPLIKDNDEMQAAWNKVAAEHELWNKMQRVDRLARLNSFSLLLFGFAGGGSMESPLRTGGKKELIYIRPVAGRTVTEIEFDDNVKSPRFGLPNKYKIEFDNPTDRGNTRTGARTRRQRAVIVHASRVVHVVENPLEDSVFGEPIMEKVYNLLDDLLKVAGGTPEVFWLTANRGMQADIDSDLDIDPADAKALAEEIEEYQHQLRRVIKTRGVKMNVLETTMPMPKETFEMLIGLLSGTTGIPRRILLGSEAGQLASEQDRANWAERIDERRDLFAEPHVLNPTARLLQAAGLLPEGMVEWVWPSAFILSPLEGSMVMAQTARAIGNISRQTGNKVPMQLTSRIEARDLIGLEGDLEETDIIKQPDENGGRSRTEDDDARAGDDE